MSRTDLLQAAIDKLQEAAHLLTEAGEERLALEATELTEWVDFSIRSKVARLGLKLHPNLRRFSPSPHHALQCSDVLIRQLKPLPRLKRPPIDCRSCCFLVGSEGERVHLSGLRKRKSQSIRMR